MSQIAYILPGRVGERIISIADLHRISEARLEEFQVELATIAERDGLIVEIEKLFGRGFRIQWAPADKPWPW